MSAKIYFGKVRRCLFARGILGGPAARLVEELEDHFALKVQDARGAGYDAAAAERLALEALGTPESVAGSAAENMREASWMARHPWLFSLGLGFSALVANQFFLVAVIAIAGLHLDPGPWVGAEAQVLAAVMNWTMLVAGGAGLFALARQNAMGWKTLFLAGLSMTICLSLVGVWTVSAFAPDDLRVVLECSPLGALCGACSYNLSEFSNLASPTAQMFLLHLFTPVLVLLAIRFAGARVMMVCA
jgi:hypothetical protein